MANLIVNEGNRYTVDPLYQWDKNQVLYIYGLDVNAPEIHFSTDEIGRAHV